ncbi:MAG: hypothetical protein LBM74_10325 [Oscillospiraceae bacterium]|jgi:hypothetical protein|nr:hypothetical protein [Oscillospiraceae bacterium]
MMVDKKSEIEKGESIMPTAIREAIDSEKRNLDEINSYLRKQIKLVEECNKLPDSNKKKMKMQQEIQRKYQRLGIITKNGNLTKRYQ